MKTRRYQVCIPDFRRKSQEQFRLQFQRALKLYLGGHQSLAEGFGIVWEETLEKVPLDDDSQARLYRELITWAKGDELFTGPRGSELLQAWRQAAYEF
jgi:hypothetical protein